MMQKGRHKGIEGTYTHDVTPGSARTHAMMFIREAATRAAASLLLLP